MNKVLQDISSIGRLAEDLVFQKNRKSFLVFLTFFMSMGGVLWGTISCLYGLYVQSSIPFGYVVISILNMTYFKLTKDFVKVRFIQVLISLVLPFLFQWSLGGYFSSGLIMIWSLFALFASLSYDKIKYSLLWWVFFIVCTLISGFYQDWFTTLKPEILPDYSLLFLVINVTVVSSLIFGLVLYLVDLIKTTITQLEYTNKELRSALGNLEKTQDQLVETEKMASLGVLASGITHEINNPLNFIKGGVQALESEMREVQGTNEIQPYFKIINEGVGRAADIVKSLSHFSRETAKMSETCDIHEILDNCLLMLENKLKHRIEVVRAYGADAMDMKGNAGRLHQAFLNVLANAEQAILDSGEIRISTRINEDQLEVIIADTGVGISPENLSKINDPFFTTKPPGVGTGLGLSITYNILREHQGTIDVNSTPGEGTTFLIKLPQLQENGV